MQSEDFRAWIVFGLTVFGVLGSGLMFSLNLILKPIRVAIDNSTEATRLIRHAVKEMDTKVDSHENRLNKIETTHELRGCNVPLRRSSDN